jgi:hypothetical protein
MSGHHVSLSGLLCPYCSVRLDCADGLPSNLSATPTAGAVSVCVECAEPALFVDGPFGMAFRKPTQDERASIMAAIGPALMMYKMQRRMRRT